MRTVPGTGRVFPECQYHPMHTQHSSAGTRLHSPLPLASLLWYLLPQGLGMEVSTLGGALKAASRTNNTTSLFPTVYSFWSNQSNNDVCYY